MIIWRKLMTAYLIQDTVINQALERLFTLGAWVAPRCMHAQGYCHDLHFLQMTQVLDIHIDK